MYWSETVCVVADDLTFDGFDGVAVLVSADVGFDTGECCGTGCGRA